MTPEEFVKILCSDPEVPEPTIEALDLVIADEPGANGSPLTLRVNISVLVPLDVSGATDLAEILTEGLGNVSRK